MTHKHHQEKPKKRKDVTQARYTVFCCQGKDCHKHGARDTQKALYAEVKDAGLKGEINVIKCECTDQCKHGPIVIVSAGAAGLGTHVAGTGGDGLVWYSKVQPKDARAIARSHLEKGEIMIKRLYRPLGGEGIITEQDTSDDGDATQRSKESTAA